MVSFRQTPDHHSPVPLGMGELFVFEGCRAMKNGFAFAGAAMRLGRAGVGTPL